MGILWRILSMRILWKLAEPEEPEHSWFWADPYWEEVVEPEKLDEMLIIPIERFEQYVERGGDWKRFMPEKIGVDQRWFFSWFTSDWSFSKPRRCTMEDVLAISGLVLEKARLAKLQWRSLAFLGD